MAIELREGFTNTRRSIKNKWSFCLNKIYFPENIYISTSYISKQSPLFVIHFLQRRMKLGENPTIASTYVFFRKNTSPFFFTSLKQSRNTNSLSFWSSNHSEMLVGFWLSSYWQQQRRAFFWIGVNNRGIHLESHWTSVRLWKMFKLCLSTWSFLQLYRS